MADFPTFFENSTIDADVTPLPLSRDEAIFNSRFGIHVCRLECNLDFANYLDQNNFDYGQSYALHILMKLDFILAT